MKKNEWTERGYCYVENIGKYLYLYHILCLIGN